MMPTITNEQRGYELIWVPSAPDHATQYFRRYPDGRVEKGPSEFDPNTTHRPFTAVEQFIRDDLERTFNPPA